MKQIRFKVELNANKRTEYSDFEDELKNQLNIEANFDGDGCVQLTYDEISRGLDSIIRKKFSSLLEREKKIGCILSIRPFNLEERITRKYPDHKFRVEQNGRVLFISGIGSDINDFPNYLQKILILSTLTETVSKFILKMLITSSLLNMLISIRSHLEELRIRTLINRN